MLLRRCRLADQPEGTVQLLLRVADGGEELITPATDIVVVDDIEQLAQARLGLGLRHVQCHITGLRHIHRVMRVGQ